ncbi:hypothetical protein [Staphylococcus aureus]|uniref:hypothetical protein n=1 Tax=Staphylococcus aureus TaxID=1280 RepID=UPI00211A275D|nr:hypothetical protein [Staphylococcus aureus]
MKDSIFWKKAFIPVYFIVAMLVFLLFRFYIKTDNFSIYLMIKSSPDSCVKCYTMFLPFLLIKIDVFS